ncbi:hypothetical protein DFH28DRAFT_889483, partial [Melampsora americana]
KSKRAQAKRNPSITKKAEPRTHKVPIHLRPDIPAHHFQSVYRRRTQVAEYLHRHFENPRIINVDFDLASAYFLQHTHHLNLGDIPFSIDKVFEDFSILEPLTGMQDALLTCVHHIKSTLDVHAANPESPLPFALQYPNLESLNNLAINRSVNPQIVGKGEAVVFVDLAGRVVAVSAQPKESKLTTTLSGQERGRIALVGAAAVNDIAEFVGPMTHKTFARAIHPPPTPTAQSPYAVLKTATSNLSGAKSSYIEIPGVLNGTLPSQAIGYGRYAELRAGMSDRQMALGEARQGHPSSGWQEHEVSHYNLPTVIQMGKQTGYKREDQARIDAEMLWPLELGRLIIKAFMPKSYDCALKALQVIVREGNCGAARKLKDLVNPVGIGKHVMYGMQVDHHRDGNNAPLFASANFFGKNYGGGELILNYLGYAVHGGPGYLVHAAFDVLMHGVSCITCLPHLPGCPPQRICMAIYSHANVFAGAARYSGMNQSPKVFSDRRLWILFYPADFKLSEVLAIFKSEQKRLHKKYKEECIAHHSAKRSAEAAALDL